LCSRYSVTISPGCGTSGRTDDVRVLLAMSILDREDLDRCNQLPSLLFVGLVWGRLCVNRPKQEAVGLLQVHRKHPGEVAGEFVAALGSVVRRPEVGERFSGFQGGQTQLEFLCHDGAIPTTQAAILQGLAQLLVADLYLHTYPHG